MAKLVPIAAIAAITLLAGCGGSTSTVTVTPSAPSTSTSVAGAAACFKAAGASVRGPKVAGRGTAVYGVTKDGAVVGLVKAPSAAIASRLQLSFSGGSSAFRIRVLKGDPTAFGVYKGKLSSADSALLSKCAK